MCPGRPGPAAAAAATTATRQAGPGAAAGTSWAEDVAAAATRQAEAAVALSVAGLPRLGRREGDIHAPSDNRAVGVATAGPADPVVMRPRTPQAAMGGAAAAASLGACCLDVLLTAAGAAAGCGWGVSLVAAPAVPAGSFVGATATQSVWDFPVG